MFRTLAASLSAATLATSALADAPRPNIIFVLTDDTGFGDLGVYFQNSRDFANNRNLPAFKTPGLDAMAAQGVRMDHHYTPAPVCAPARASFLLGVHQGHSNVRDNQFDKAISENHTVATILKEAGYATAVIGKWGLQGGPAFPGHPLNRGFDYFHGYMGHGDAHHHYPKEQGRSYFENFTNIVNDLDKCYSTDLATARSKKWIVDHVDENADQPFFLYLAYAAPHAQLNVPTGPYPPGFGLNGGVQWTGTPGAMINTATGPIDTWIHPDYASATWDHDNDPSTPEVAWPSTARRHATMMRRLDDAMTDIFQLLADLEIDDNTLVVFTSDNGPHNEQGIGGGSIGSQDPRFFRSYGPLDGIKRDVWEGGIRVPTLVRWPGGIPAGRVSTHPSQFHDWLPTFAEVAGLPLPFRSDGVSLVPDLTGTGAQREGVVYVEYTTGGSNNTPNYADFHPSHRNATRGHMQAIFLGGYKGVRYNTSSASTPFRVYDVANDPQETTNLAGQPGVPTQAEFEARVVQVRRVDGVISRPYDSVQIPATIPIPDTPVTLLRSDFEGRVLAGTTASGFSWTSDVGEQGNATTSLAFTGSATGFIGGYGLTSGALNPPGQPIPVEGNIETVGPWSTSFQFTPSADRELASVGITCYAINASGGHQSNSKNIRWDVSITGGALDVSAHATGNDPGGNGALFLPVDFAGTTLVGGATYTITLTVSSPDTPGNNIALNSIALVAPSISGEVPAVMEPGLGYAAYEGDFPWVPDFTTETPAATGESIGLDLSVRTRDEHIGIAFEGFLNVPSSGIYTFFLTTDTAAFVRLHDVQLIDADFGYQGGSERSSGSIPLQAGLHPIRIHYRHGDAVNHMLDLQWQGPGIAKQSVPDGNFLIQAQAVPPNANDDETSAVSGVATEIAVLANDGAGFGLDPLTIVSITQPNRGTATINPGSTTVTYTSKPGFAGTDSFTYTISNGEATDTATVTVNVLPETSTIWLPFDETSGNIAHDAFGRPLGSLVGFATPDWVPGILGGALRFFGDGDSDQVILNGNKGVNGTAARTVSFWINADANQGGVRSTIVSWGANNSTTIPGNRFDINLNHSSGHRLRVELNASGVNFSTPSRTDLRGAGWVHCAIVMPAGATVSQLLGYLDGVLATPELEPAGSGAVTIDTSAMNDVHIGSWATDDNRPFRGLIDDVRIYHRALSASEIAELAALTPDRAFANAWHFRHTGNDLPSIADWRVDADGDGFNALLEFALGGNPTVASRAIAPFLNSENVFVFNRRQSGLAASAYVVEFSSNLEAGSWAPLPVSSAVAHPDLPGFDQVTAILPELPEGRCFSRLRVTGP